MRKICVGLFMIPLAALLGCSGTGTPGGSGTGGHRTNPGTTSPAPVVGKEPGTFTLSVPSGLLATHIKQGEAKTIKIGVKKGENFQEDVVLKFKNLPKGVTVDPAEPIIRTSDKEITVTLKAAADAAVGDAEVDVVGEAKGGPPAENKFKLSVDKK